ncbi:MAG: DNA polymerase [Bacteroidales bacterium]|nr:DNA polymerase [Candidatus Scybalousia scybalohippi]
MKTLSIDIETYSSANLSKCGVYKYIESPDFDILLFGYSVDGGEVVVVDLANGEKLPTEVLEALTEDNVIKWAFNAQFERVCISRWLGMKSGEYLNPKSWRCSMIWSAYMGLPLSLEGVGAVLGLEKQKLVEGKELIRYFCGPCRATKTNGNRTRNMPIHDIDKWELFKKYNKRDVEVEMSIQDKLHKFPVPDFVWDEYHLDQEINDRGIKVDASFVRNAIEIDEESHKQLILDVQGLTAVANPNSVAQMKEWLENNGVVVESLGKKDVAKLLKESTDEVSQVLALRQKISRSSVKKYMAMENSLCDDGRVRGMFQFYGANRTGRFAGRLVQLQNLPQNHMSDLAEAREIVKSSDYELLDSLYADIPDTLSQLIRTAFIPEGELFYVADFSAIEARVIAWLAGENWRTEVFKEGGDIYCASASQMFGVPVEKHGVNGHLRQKGKIAELALGYGGSVGALKAMGALDMGLTEEELKPLVDAWRNSNKKIVRLWWDVDNAVKTAIKERRKITLKGLSFSLESGILFIELPSGRRLAYIKPRIGENQFGGESVTYEGVGGTKKWERLESYGPKFVENVVQAISRDILMYAMMNMRDERIVAHVHDEMIIEARDGLSLNTVCSKMGETPHWAEGLILRADGYTCNFYMKD